MSVVSITRKSMVEAIAEIGSSDTVEASSAAFLKEKVGIFIPRTKCMLLLIIYIG
ncbi:hypothetical protein GCM10027340_19420 [Marinomonas epiphytica]